MKIKEFFNKILPYVYGLLALALFMYLYVEIEIFIKKEYAFYDDVYKKEFSMYLKDAKMRWFNSREEYQRKKREEILNVVDKLEKTLKDYEVFIQNVCYAYFKEKNVEKEIARTTCPCVSKKYMNRPIWYTEYIINNFENFSFLVYKGDEKAVEVDNAYREDMISCLEEQKNSLK
jgi:hypothetical protein